MAAGLVLVVLIPGVWILGWVASVGVSGPFAAPFTTFLAALRLVTLLDAQELKGFLNWSAIFSSSSKNADMLASITCLVPCYSFH